MPQPREAAATISADGVRFADVRGHRLEYVDVAARDAHRPPLVLLHEGLGSVAMWRDFPASIAAATGCRVVAYSRHGFGRSSPRHAPYTPRFMHDEAFEVLPALRAALALDRPILVGHSTGASMALIHAAQPASDVRGIVAMAPLVFVEDFNLQSIRGARARYATTEMRDKLARYHADADTVFRGWTDIWLHPQFRDWSIAADLERVRCPILAILGDQDAYSTPAQVAALERAAVHAARCERLTLAECGHAPHRDRPDAVIDAIVRFVTQVGPSTRILPAA